MFHSKQFQFVKINVRIMAASNREFRETAQTEEEELEEEKERPEYLQWRERELIFFLQNVNKNETLKMYLSFSF